MHQYIKIMFLTACLFQSTAFGQTLNDKIDQLIKRRLPKATVAVFVQEADTNRVIFQRNADKLLSPASGIKLYTAIAALYGLGPNYRFVTKLLQHSNHYYLQFSGAPSLSVKELSKLLSQLSSQAMGTAPINFVIDSAHFKSPDYPDGVSFDDLGWYYAAPDTAAILDQNAVAYHFITGRQVHTPVTIKPLQEHTGIHIINELTTVNRKDEKKHCRFNVEIKPNNTLRLYGCMAKSKHHQLMKLAVPSPIIRAQEVIKNILKEQGTPLKSPIKNGLTPLGAKEIARIESHRLFDLVRHMLKDSDNLYANSLTKELGFVKTGVGTYKQGVYAIKQTISKHTNLNLKGEHLADGMGTRYNLVSAKHFVNLLAAVYRDKKMKSLLLKALPRSGHSGTLTGRMRASPLIGKVYAKTGGMHDISSLSGYLIDGKRKPLIFSIIINGIDKPLVKARLLEEEIMLAVYQSRNKRK